MLTKMTDIDTGIREELGDYEHEHEHEHEKETEQNYKVRPQGNA